MRTPELRTRPIERPAAKREVRRCKVCQGPVAALNGGDTCFRCEERAAAERHERYLASPEGKRAMAEMKEVKRQRAVRRAVEEYGLVKPTRRGPIVIEVNGVKLVPATLPKTGWPAVVEAFLASGEECVEIQSEKAAKSIYMAVGKVCKGTAAKAVTVDGKCYLVRVGGR